MTRFLITAYPDARDTLVKYGEVFYESKLNVQEGRKIFGFETNYHLDILSRILREELKDFSVRVSEEGEYHLSTASHEPIDCIERIVTDESDIIVEDDVYFPWEPESDNVYPFVTERQREYREALIKIQKTLQELNTTHDKTSAYDYLDDISSIVNNLKLEEEKKEWEVK